MRWRSECTKRAPRSAPPLATTDKVAAGLFAMLLLGETLADRQMFAYQTEKSAAS